MPIGSSAGEYFADDSAFLVDQYKDKMPEPKPIDESRPKVYITPPSTSSTMPLGRPTEAAGEFKSEAGTQVPEKPPLSESIKSMLPWTPVGPEEAKRMTTITPEDIETGMNVGMATSGGGMATKGYLTASGEFAATMKAKYGTGWIGKATEEEYQKYNELILQKTGKVAAWFKGDTIGIPKDVQKYQGYIDMFKNAALDKMEQASEVIDNLSPKEAFQKGVETLHGQFQNMREKFMTDLKNTMAVPSEKGYTEPAFRGLSIYKNEGEPSSIHNYYGSNYLYSSNSPMLADMYAGYLNQHPGYHVPEHAFSSGAQVMPLVINTKDYHYYDAAGGHWTEHNQKAIQEAKKKKMKGVVVDRVSDEPNSTTTLPPKTVYITFPEGAGTVKSRFAKEFDPTSPDMLKGIGAIGIGTAATGYVATDENLSQ